MEGAMYLDWAFILRTLNARPESRNFIEAQRLLNANHIIMCESTGKTHSSISVYALCLQTSAMNTGPHRIESTFQHDGSTVIEACGLKCTCKAGASEKCKHVAAVLLYCSRNDMNQLNIISQTDKECSWSNRKRPALAQYTPMPLRETKCFPNVQRRDVKINYTEIATILMNACPDSAITKHRKGRTLDAQLHAECLPLQLEDFDEEILTNEQLGEIGFVLKHINEDNNKWMQFVDELDIKPLHECCHDFYQKKIFCEDPVQLCAKTHFNRNLWIKERQFRITGLRCYEIYTYSKNDWSSKASKYFWPKRYKKIDSLEHGLLYEAPAREAYKMSLSKEEDIMQIGLIVSKHNPWLGYTPDGIITKNGQPSKLLEIKCIVKGKDMSASEAVKTCSYVNCKNDVYALKSKHKYYAQVQLGMALLNVDATDFIIYASKDNSFINVSVHIDENFVKNLLKN